MKKITLLFFVLFAACAQQVRPTVPFKHSDDSNTANQIPVSNASFLPNLQSFLGKETANSAAEYGNLNFVDNSSSDSTTNACIGGTGAGLTMTITTCIAYNAGFRSTCGVGNNLGLGPGGTVPTSTTSDCPGGNSITFPNNSTCWVSMDENTTGSNAGLPTSTRVTGTHYLTDCTDTTPPAQAADSQLLMKVVTSAGAITAVTDFRNTSPLYSNKVLTPFMFGAKCDGLTDDHTALQNMINSCTNTQGARFIFQSGIRCLSSGQLVLPINANGCTFEQGSPQQANLASENTTGIYFTTAPSTCTFGSGGDFLITNFDAGIKFDGIGLWSTVQSSAGGSDDECILNISGTGALLGGPARIHITHAYIGGSLVTPINMIGLWTANTVNMQIDNSVFEQGMKQWIKIPATAGTFMNVLKLFNNRFAAQSPTIAYNYGWDGEATQNVQSEGLRSVSIENNSFEVGPNVMKMAGCLGCSIKGNWTGDATYQGTWTNGKTITAPSGGMSCIAPTTWNSTNPYIFCSTASGTTGAGEPSWGTAASPGQTIGDNGLTWENMGPGIAFDLALTGDVTSNQLCNQDPAELLLEPFGSYQVDYNGSGILTTGNIFCGNDNWELKDDAVSANILGNFFLEYSTYNPAIGLLLIGDGSHAPRPVFVGLNYYQRGGGVGQAIYVKLAGSTAGQIMWDSSLWTVNANLTDNSGTPSLWHIMDVGSKGLSNFPTALAVNGNFTMNNGLMLCTQTTPPTSSSGTMDTRACDNAFTVSGSTVTPMTVTFHTALSNAPAGSCTDGTTAAGLKAVWGATNVVISGFTNNDTVSCNMLGHS